MSDDKDPEDKPKSRSCTTCKQFLTKDPHLDCIVCRSCRRDDTCELCKDWPGERWTEVELEVDRRALQEQQRREERQKKKEASHVPQAGATVEIASEELDYEEDPEEVPGQTVLSTEDPFGGIFQSTEFQSAVASAIATVLAKRPDSSHKQPAYESSSGSSSPRSRSRSPIRLQKSPPRPHTPQRLQKSPPSRLQKSPSRQQESPSRVYPPAGGHRSRSPSRRHKSPSRASRDKSPSRKDSQRYEDSPSRRSRDHRRASQRDDPTYPGLPKSSRDGLYGDDSHGSHGSGYSPYGYYGRASLDNREKGYYYDQGTAREHGEVRNSRGNRDLRGEYRGYQDKFDKYDSRAPPGPTEHRSDRHHGSTAPPDIRDIWLPGTQEGYDTHQRGHRPHRDHGIEFRDRDSRSRGHRSRSREELSRQRLEPRGESSRGGESRHNRRDPYTPEHDRGSKYHNPPPIPAPYGDTRDHESVEYDYQDRYQSSSRAEFRDQERSGGEGDRGGPSHAAGRCPSSPSGHPTKSPGPSAGSSKPSLPSFWDKILPAPVPEINVPPTQESHVLSWDDVGECRPSPSFKPDQSRLMLQDSQGKADSARRKILQDSDPGKQQQEFVITPELGEQIRGLGEPYALELPEESGGKGEDHWRYLSPEVSAPFFAAALIDAKMPVEFPKTEEAEDPELGLARRSTPPKPPRPYIPMVKDLQKYIRSLQDQKSAPRIKWVERSFVAPPEMEKEFFVPPPVPEDCWQQMSLDRYSWCRPDQNPPEGVEGSGPAQIKGPAKAKETPHKVLPWDISRDRELRDLEALARDGLKVANAALITFAHLINGTLDPSRVMSKEAQRRTLFTLKDLEHVSAEHFARLAHRLAMQRKINAVRALSLTRPREFLATPIGPDLFGGKWTELHNLEKERRKARAEADKERQKTAKLSQARQTAAYSQAKNQAKGPPRGGQSQNQSFRVPKAKQQGGPGGGGGQQQKKGPPQGHHDRGGGHPRGGPAARGGRGGGHYGGRGGGPRGGGHQKRK